MRILALDIGKVRCGIAVSDPAERIAFPVCVLPTSEVENNAASFRRVCQDWEPELLVAGLPLSLDGATGTQALSVKKTAEHIADTLGLPLEFSDERLSSTQAKRIFKEKGYSEREMRGKIDMVAASLFLQSWLDARIEQSE